MASLRWWWRFLLPTLACASRRDRGHGYILLHTVVERKPNPYKQKRPWDALNIEAKNIDIIRITFKRIKNDEKKRLPTSQEAWGDKTRRPRVVRKTHNAWGSEEGWHGLKTNQVAERCWAPCYVTQDFIPSGRRKETKRSFTALPPAVSAPNATYSSLCRLSTTVAYIAAIAFRCSSNSGRHTCLRNRIPTMPGWSTSGFHRPGRHCLRQTRRAVR